MPTEPLVADNVAVKGVGVGVLDGVAVAVGVGVSATWAATDCPKLALARFQWMNVTPIMKIIRLHSFNPRITFSHHVI